MNILATVLNKFGVEFELSLPAKRIVCPCCDGAGTELRGGLKGLAISDESMQDDDFRESYFGGDYDVQCSECKGENVVLVVDETKLSPRMLERYHRALQAKQDYELEKAHERRMGY